jgi:hypothetical protein
LLVDHPHELGVLDQVARLGSILVGETLDLVSVEVKVEEAEGGGKG